MELKAIVQKMSLNEKCVLLSGKNMWQTQEYPHHGIPALWVADGPHGMRKQATSPETMGLNPSVAATCFPTAAAVANSWNVELGEQIGRALGQEAAAQDVGVVLGPGLNMKRSPLCGRNFEYFSEDPHLAGKLAAAYIRGIQANGVGACPKHFAANSQELRRMASNSVLDERTLREIYLTGFEIAVTEGHPRTIMSSYNQINGTYSNENAHLLQQILRQEWGFDGAVITDWGASNDHVAGVKAGSNLEMPAPGDHSPRWLIDAVKRGELDEAVIDARVEELLGVILPCCTAVERAEKQMDEEAHHQLACRAAAESAVLLKNENDLLPIAAGTRVAVIGDFAFLPRYQGAGSSRVNPTRLQSTVEVLPQLLPRNGWTLVGTARGFERSGGGNEALQNEAVELAKRADVVVLYLGLDELSESEGSDRKTMQMPQNQLQLLDAVRGACGKVAVVLSAGSPVELHWAEQADALVYGCLSGQAGAEAMLQVLAGVVNPSGKLAETFPLRLEDTPAALRYPARRHNAEYREGLYMGYRYYQTVQQPVAYPFGYGLSYTRFAYSDMQASESEVTFTLTNTGSRPGAEVVQLYVAKLDAQIFRPAKELKAFAKVLLQPGESRRVTLPLDERTFRYWNVQTNRWEVEGGTYQLQVAASADDVRLTAEVTVEGTGAPNPYAGREELLAPYYTGKVQQVADPAFEALLGHELPAAKAADAPLTLTDPLYELRRARSAPLRLVSTVIEKKLAKAEREGRYDLDLQMAYEMPLRGMAGFTGGAISREMVEQLLVAANGQFWRGMTGFVKGYFANRKANKVLRDRLAFDALPVPGEE